MSREIATPKQTGGGGFAFEDKVSAWYLLLLLRAEHPFEDSLGLIAEVSFQKGVDGWLIDDLVLSLHVNGRTASVAISIKSNAQLTKKGFPKEFVKDAWELARLDGPFQVGRDALCLATAPVDIEVQQACSSLLGKLVTADEERFAKRLSKPGYANEIERNTFGSLGCPAEVATGVAEAEVVRLAKSIRHRSFDFDAPDSQDKAVAISKCRELLAEGDSETASALWETLQVVARDVRVTGGEIALTQLADKLRRGFRLHAYPDHRLDWQNLATICSSRLREIGLTVGGEASLSLETVSVPTTAPALVQLVGPSGSGKSGAARRLVESLPEEAARVWLTPDDLNTHDLAGLRRSLGLQSSLSKLITSCTAQDAVLVVDSAEKLTSDGIRRLKLLVEATRPTNAASPWRTLITCTEDRWPAVWSEMASIDGINDISTRQAASIDFADHRQAVCAAFPQLAGLFSRDDVGQLCSNLKILDLLAKHAKAASFGSDTVGEVAVADWYWSEIVAPGNDVARSSVAQKLAGLEANRFEDGVATSDETLSAGDAIAARQLGQCGVLSINDERIRFDHDLTADWARSRFLLSRGDQASASIAEKASNPRWHRAIRLHGLRQIESSADGADRWLRLVKGLKVEGKYTLQSDLVLDAVVLAPTARQMIESVWQQLTTDGGELLKRLLTRFLQVGTTADPRFNVSGNSALAASLRVPLWRLWPPLLAALIDHKDEVIPLAVGLVSDIAFTWLKQTPDGTSYRAETAELLVQSAKHVIAEKKRQGWRYSSDVAQKVFRCLPVAARVEPAAVDLLLQLVERRSESPFHVDPGPGEAASEKNAWLLRSYTVDESNLADPWPDGPLRALDSDVEKAFLDDAGSLTPLFRVDANAACEALLALLIREPLPEPDATPIYFDPADDFLDLSDCREWSPPLYFRGPFLSWLRLDPVKAIEVVVKLVDFATDRWLERQTDPPPTVRVLVEGQWKDFAGGLPAWSWHRDWPGTNPAVASALMALEQWLYDQSEEQGDVKEAVERLLSKSHSVSILGVLCTLGRRYPKLFAGPLRPLVHAWRLLAFDIEYAVQGLDQVQHSGLSLMRWRREGQSAADLAMDWHRMPHRKVPLLDRYIAVMLSDRAFADSLAEVRERWRSELRTLNGQREQSLVESSAAKLDPENWRVSREGNDIRVEYVEPADLREKYDADRAAIENRQADLSLPYQCREQLLKREPLPPGQLETLWAQLQRQYQAYEKAPRSDRDRIADQMMGGVAILESLHPNWLSEDEARLQFCSDVFNLVWDDPPPLSPYTVPESVGGTGWRNFAAFLVIPALASDPSKEGWRSLAASLAFGFEFSVVADVMSLAFEHRQSLGEDFGRLQHLVVQVAALREIETVIFGGNNVWHTPKADWNVNEHLDRLHNRFVDKSLPATPPRLVDVARSTNETIFEIVDRDRLTTSKVALSNPERESVRARIDLLWGFEPGVIQAGFGWIEKIEGFDLAERSQTIALLSDLNQAAVRPLAVSLKEDDDDDERDFYSFPPDFASWAINLTTKAMVFARDSKQAIELASPFMNLGLARNHWTERFASSWAIRVVEHPDHLDRLVETWRAMIELAWESPAWQISDDWRGGREELFRSLHGLGFGGFLTADERVLDALPSLHDEFERWGSVFLTRVESFKALCSLLRQSVPDGFLRDGLAWLASAIGNMEARAWRDDSGVAPYALRLIDEVVSNSRIDLAADDSSRGHVLTIARQLADQQVPGAAVFYERLA